MRAMWKEPDQNNDLNFLRQRVVARLAKEAEVTSMLFSLRGKLAHSSQMLDQIRIDLIESCSAQERLETVYSRITLTSLLNEQIN